VPDLGRGKGVEQEERDDKVGVEMGMEMEMGIRARWRDFTVYIVASSSIYTSSARISTWNLDWGAGMR
jgi:hypothetical protein